MSAPRCPGCGREACQAEMAELRAEIDELTVALDAVRGRSLAWWARGWTAGYAAGRQRRRQR